MNASRLSEPVRGRQERKAVGDNPATAVAGEGPEGPRRTMKVLAGVRTIRRI